MILPLVLVTVFLIGDSALGQPPDKHPIEPVGYEVQEIPDDLEESDLQKNRPLTNVLVDREEFSNANSSKILDSTGSETINSEEALHHEDDAVVISSLHPVSMPPILSGEDDLRREINEEDLDYEDGRGDQINELKEGERSAQYSALPGGLMPGVHHPGDGLPPWLFPRPPHRQPVLHHIEHAILNPTDEEDYPLDIPQPPIPPYLQPYDGPVFNPYRYFP